MAPTADSLLVILCTFPNIDAAGEAAHALVRERLCACVNILPPMRSIYPWQGEIENTSEILCILKTTAARFPQLEARLRELHTYDVPEIIALRAESVSQSYLAWALQETSPLPPVEDELA